MCNSVSNRLSYLVGYFDLYNYFENMTKKAIFYQNLGFLVIIIKEMDTYC